MINRKLISIFLVISMCLLCLTSCSSHRLTDADGRVRVCLIVSNGGIEDGGYNQLSYEAAVSYCAEKGIPFTYKKGDDPGDFTRMAVYDSAVEEGYNLIISVDSTAAGIAGKATKKYPDVNFALIDVDEENMLSQSNGQKYYDNPSAYNVYDTFNTENTRFYQFREQIAGYLAGYGTVKMGYRNFGFLGGMDIPAINRYGYGFLRGIDDAAKELGVSDKIKARYAFTGQFGPSPEIMAAMDTWYSSGTEIIFSCGGAIVSSVAESAGKFKGKMIGVDSDQKDMINRYGDDIAVTSALKNIRAAIYDCIDRALDGSFRDGAGEFGIYGVVSAEENDRNYCALPIASTCWCDDFTEADYRQLISDILDGTLKINYDISKRPELSYSVEYRDGTIM